MEGVIYYIDHGEKWDRRFLELASHISSWSRDPSTKTGCVIVDGLKRVIAIGYNGFPRMFPDNEDLYVDRETKYKYICHADRNALDNAPCSVEKMVMYITHPPCLECQKSIIQKGIQKVVFWQPDQEFLTRWYKGVDMLNAAGIQVKGYYR